MKAIVYNELGNPDVLKIQDVPSPTPKDHEVIIEVAFAGINHTDIHFRKGIPGMASPLPHIAGCDGAGKIIKIGKDVDKHQIGDLVYINPAIFCQTCEFCQKGDLALCRKQKLIGREVSGTYAQLIAVDQNNALKIPLGFDMQIASCSALVYVTAWRMVTTRANLQKDETVFIMGAGSGVGMAAIQIAKMMGAKIISTAGGSEKCKKAKDILGIEHVVDYTKVKLADALKDLTQRRGVDVIIDHVGGSQWVPLLQSLKNGGRLVTCGATDGFDPKTDLRHIFFRQLNIMGSTMGSPEELEAVMKHIFEGKLRPHIDCVLPLSQAKVAHEKIESRNVFGKILLQVLET